MQSMQRSKSRTKVPTLLVQNAIANGNKENEPTQLLNSPVALNPIKKSVSSKETPISSRISLKGSHPGQAPPSSRRKEKPNSKPSAHRFQKKIFSKPTWCEFANKFIWGLNKSGYECRVCGLAVSRKYISQAKKLTCGEKDGLVDVSTEVAQLTKNRVFTIYLPHGAKKSVFLNPTEPLRNVLEKVCRERGINLMEFVPEDTNGMVIDLDTTLGHINGSEITFTKKDNSDSRVLSVSSSPNIPPASALISPREKKPKLPEPFKKSGRTKSQLTLDKLEAKSPVHVVEKKPKKVIEMYEVGGELGSGAFSIVKAATHKETLDVVAIKILDKYEDDDEQTQKFKQEIDIISNLHHENIVKFYELDEDEENFYVVMELVGGGELFDFIIENGALSEKDSGCIIAQVLKAVEYMHNAGIAHRDLKPENLLFKDNEHKIIKIADFGESKSFSHVPLTTYCGTPDYMAPEIIRGEPYGWAVDIWAIGVITYVMLAGFPPFDGENDVEVFASILSVRYDFPSPEWDHISQDAKNFIKSILNENVSQRLTASQCLNHPWILNTVPEDLRINKAPKNIPPNSPKMELNDDKPVKLDGEYDKKKLLDELHDLEKYAENTVHIGEVKSMQTILETTGGNSTVGSDLEKVIFQTYYKRIGEVRSLVKKSKKGKKSKKDV